MSESKTFFSTFITGTDQLIEKAIKKRPLEKIKIVQIMDGFIVYESSYEIREIRNIRFFNNSFILLNRFDNLKENPLEEMADKLIKDSRLAQQISSNIKSKEKSFKIVTSQENQTVSIHKTLLKRLESKINKENKLTLNIKRFAIEFWLIARRDGHGFFGIRLTKKDRHTDKGELRSELAHILCLASNPSPKDTFLDPFAGSGAIPQERAAGFPYQKIVAIDNQDESIQKLKRRFGKTKRDIVIIKDSALELSSVKDGSIDKIVTDPPWGYFEKTRVPTLEFYQKMLVSFARVLKSGGIVVLLSANKLEIQEKLKEFERIFSLLARYDILVSGKKAAIYKIKKL